MFNTYFLNIVDRLSQYNKMYTLIHFTKFLCVESLEIEPTGAELTIFNSYWLYIIPYVANLDQKHCYWIERLIKLFPVLDPLLVNA